MRNLVAKKNRTTKNYLRFSLIITLMITFNNVYPEDSIKKLPNDTYVAGKLGILQFIVVPVEKSKDKEFYENIIRTVCPEKKSCFLNFFTNSKNVKLGFPLNEKILAEPTVMFKRSAKHQNTILEWSCRLKKSVGTCF